MEYNLRCQPSIALLGPLSRSADGKEEGDDEEEMHKVCEICMTQAPPTRTLQVMLAIDKLFHPPRYGKDEKSGITEYRVRNYASCGNQGHPQYTKLLVDFLRLQERTTPGAILFDGFASLDKRSNRRGESAVALDTLNAVCASSTHLSLLGLDDIDLVQHTVMISVRSCCSSTSAKAT